MVSPLRYVTGSSSVAAVSPACALRRRFTSNAPPISATTMQHTTAAAMMPMSSGSGSPSALDSAFASPIVDESEALTSAVKLATPL